MALCDVDPNYAAQHDQAVPASQVLRRLPRDARQAEGHRRRGGRHARPHARGDLDGRHAGRQARLLPEAADARRLRGPHAGPGRQGGKVATQMGIQGHSMEGIRLICEWIWAGRDRRGPRGRRLVQPDAIIPGATPAGVPSGRERPQDTPPVPTGLNWDLWIGPAPMRPYHRAYHPATWRCWWDFGCGMMGDRGAHTLDPVFSALKLGPPTSIEATSCGNTPEVHPLSAIVTFQFPAREGLPPLKLTWYEGTRPPRPGGAGRRPPGARRGRRVHQGHAGHDHGRRLRRQPADHPRGEDAGSQAAGEDPARASRARTSRTGCGPARRASRPAPTSPTPAR